MVPGAGPAIDSDDWNVAKHPKHRRRRKPYLCNNLDLGREFRKHYVRGLRSLLRRGELKLGGSVEFLSDKTACDQWLSELESIDWNVFIQGPPDGKSDPANVVKYLAGYLSGGPIADGRIIEADEDEVRFWARPKKSSSSGSKQRGMSAPQPYRLNGRQFMQRWALHVLPKGFTRSRCYGGYHGGKRADYLAQCRELQPAELERKETPTPTSLQEETETTPRCPKCEFSLRLISNERRPSWREIFDRRVYETLDHYSPILTIISGRAPPQ